jgi:hypothetical protein
MAKASGRDGCVAWERLTDNRIRYTCDCGKTKTTNRSDMMKALPWVELHMAECDKRVVRNG